MGRNAILPAASTQSAAERKMIGGKRRFRTIFSVKGERHARRTFHYQCDLPGG
jgi:hypothetical protein